MYFSGICTSSDWAVQQSCESVSQNHCWSHLAVSLTRIIGLLDCDDFSLLTSLDWSTFSLVFAVDNSTNKDENRILMLLLITHLLLGCYISRKLVAL